MDDRSVVMSGLKKVLESGEAKVLGRGRERLRK